MHFLFGYSANAWEHRLAFIAARFINSFTFDYCASIYVILLLSYAGLCK